MNLVHAAESGNISRLRELLDRGADPNIHNSSGDTALIKASFNNKIEIARLLLDNDADPNIQNSYGDTALRWASGRGHIEIVKMLLDRGANPNIQNNDGWTALIVAVLNNNSEIIRLLLNRGADPNTRDNRATALIYASRNGLTKIVRLLLDNGADPYIRGRDGMTALMIAESEGNDDITRLIRDHIGLQKARQDLALTTFFNKHLGIDSPLNYLDESDIIKEITSKPRRYDPSINIRMMDERRRDKLTKARQRLASMRSMHSREGPISTVRYDPSIMEGISRHLSRIRPVPSVQKRLMLEDRQEDPDEDYLRTLNPREKEQFLQQRETVRKGGSKQSSRKRRRRKNKNYTRRRSFFNIFYP